MTDRFLFVVLSYMKKMNLLK